MDTISFVTTNRYKKKEAPYYLKDTKLKLDLVDHSIQEILHDNLDAIVRDKCIKAYSYLRQPCVVEHGAFYIDALDGFPGGLSKIMWIRLKDKICNLIPSGGNRKATAKVVIGYCDGKRIWKAEGMTEGTIAEKARKGKDQFEWDEIFIPGGQDLTFSELGFPAKAEFSMARKAWENLAKNNMVELRRMY